MAKPARHADPETLLGQLQRGRGEGYLRILSTPKQQASAYLIECISNDARLDSQVEHRAEYYASIAVELELDLEPLAQHLREHDDSDQSSWNTNLAVVTLGELAKRRFGHAAEILRDYVEWGQWWDWVLDDLLAVPDPGFHVKVAGAIERRFPTDEGLKETLAPPYLDDGPWEVLAQHSARIGRFLDDRRKQDAAACARDLPPSDLTLLTVKQLLDLSDGKNQHKVCKAMARVVASSDVDLLKRHVSVEKPSVAAVALAGLARLAPESIFPWLLEFWSSDSEMAGIVRFRAAEALIALPPDLTLPLARERLFHESCDERVLAEELFEAHALEEDIPSLRRAIGLGLQDDEENSHRLCSLVQAFCRFPNIGPVSELSDVFFQFRYSYGRARAANAIHITSPNLFQEKFVLECLWDCEDKTRSLAAKVAPLEQSVVAQRLRELAANVWEDETVRSEAETRLKRQGRPAGATARRAPPC